MQKSVLFLLLFTATIAFGQKEDFKTMPVPEGKAIIYLVRPAIKGSQLKMVVTLNGAEWGMTKGKNYLYKIVEPGEYKIEWKISSNAPEPLRIFAKADTKYYVLQDVKIPLVGWHAVCEFETLPAAEGIEKLKKCKLGKLLIPTQ